MATLMMLRGIPASGKSTFAKALVDEGWEEVNKDNIRATFVKESNGEWQWSHEAEKDVIKVRDTLILGALLKGRNVVVSDCNFGKHEGQLKGLASRTRSKFEMKSFTDVPLDICLERNEGRKGTEGYIAPNVIREMWEKYILTDMPVAKPVWNDDLKTVIICDLDGTLALHNGRSPYDTAKCESDLLNKPVAAVLWAMEATVENSTLLFVSGREDKFREQTQNWLGTNGFTGYPLLMRKAGDMRRDDIIKREIYEAEIKDKYNVLFILDDRDRVVAEWRRLGLTCFQVAPGNF